MTTTTAPTATATNGRYTIQIEGQTIELGSSARDYGLLVISDQGNGWKVKMKTNNESAARTKQAKQLALGDHVRCLIVPVTHL